MELDYNPYSEPYEALGRSIRLSEKEKTRHLEQITWYDSFNCDAIHSAVCAGKREADALELTLSGTASEYQAQLANLSGLKDASSLGWDPRNWFSSERLAKKQEFKSQEESLARLTQRQKELRSRITAQKDQIHRQESELERHRSLDRLKAESALRAIDSQLSALNADLVQLRILKEQVDQQLKEPLAEMSVLEQKQASLRVGMSQAESFERRLSTAPNGYERKKIHEECESRFNEAKPSRVLQSKRRELESVDRNIEKLDRRLRAIAQSASRNIKVIVIDGNNLCYEHRVFIGLRALVPVARRLSDNYSVLVVFDAVIRQKLKMGDQDIAATIGDNTKVHVVASRKKADETILDAAADEHSYVLSNDRFQDFREKAAVREQRLISHEILNGQIFIHDLRVTEALLVDLELSSS